MIKRHSLPAFVGGSLLLLAVLIPNTWGQDSLIHLFLGGPDDGFGPVGSVTSSGSALYGTTVGGGSNGCGTVFRMNSDGSGYVVLHHFRGGPDDGCAPAGSLTPVGSKLYGTTTGGGTNDFGTVFSMNLNGSGYAVLHRFRGPPGDGAEPSSALTVVGSRLYGTTGNGGSHDEGTFFAVNPDGSNYQVLYSFGQVPNDGRGGCSSLVASGPRLFGTRVQGGSNDWGTVFAINTNGANYQVLYRFGTVRNDGFSPLAAPMLFNSRLYGTTVGGGSNNWGTVFAVNPDGSGYTNLYQLPFGAAPMASLTPVGSKLVGTTRFNGTNGVGTVFALNPDGSGYALWYQFGSATNDGKGPMASLTLVGSTLYGTTPGGGKSEHGTVFALTVPGMGLWSGAADLGGGWKWLDWFGYFNVNSDPWIYHNEHGWLYATGTNTSSICFWDSAMAKWWWTSATKYPYCYRFADSAWLWYQKDSTGPRWFYNVTAKKWESW